MLIEHYPFDHWNLDVNTASLVDVEPVLSEFDIIINTTPAGMDDNLELPIHLDYLYHKHL